MVRKLNQQGVASLVVFAVIVLVAAGAIGYVVLKKNNSSSTNSASMVMSNSANSTKASDLRADLVTLGVQHMQLTAQAVDAALDGSPDATAYANALYANGNAIGTAVGSVYGKDAETTFDSVWKLHLDQFVAYAVADKKGDSAGKTAALSAIDTGYTKPLSQYLAKANPNLPEATLESVLGEHVQMTAKMIDYHVAGDYAGETNELNLSDKHIEGIFSTLSGAIVKQYPAKFQ